MSRKIIYKCTYIYNDIPGYRDKTHTQHTHIQHTHTHTHTIHKNTKAFDLVPVGETWILTEDLEYQSLSCYSQLSTTENPSYTYESSEAISASCLEGKVECQVVMLSQDTLRTGLVQQAKQQRHPS